MQPGEVIRKFGPIRGLQLIGFCHVLGALDWPRLDELQEHIREQMAREGISKSAAYRYIGYLRDWNQELGRDPDAVDELARDVAGVFAVEGERRVTSQRRETVLE